MERPVYFPYLSLGTALFIIINYHHGSRIGIILGEGWLLALEFRKGLWRFIVFVFGFTTIGSNVSLETATTCILDWQLDIAIPARDFRTYYVYTCVGL